MDPEKIKEEVDGAEEVIENDDTDTGDDTSIIENDNEENEDDGDDKPKSVRDTLKAAFKEENAKVDAENKEEKEDNEPAESKPRVAKTKQPKAVIERGEPPGGWTDTAKKHWGNLPPEVIESVAKREKEASDGFAAHGEEKKRFKELDDILAPRREYFQRNGLSEGQVVGRMFNWMDGLAGANKVDVYKELGRSFGIDIAKLAPTPSKQTSDDTSAEAASQQVAIPDEVRNFFDTITNKVTTLEQTLTSQKEAEAANFVNNWAKDKTHYSKVRPLMFSLLNSGVIPLKDGALDLDEAYAQATYAHKETRELILKEEADKKAADAKAEADKKKVAQAERVRKANTANVSIKSKAPLARGDGSSHASMNGKKPISVKDSLRSAIRELNDNA